MLPRNRLAMVLAVTLLAAAALPVAAAGVPEPEAFFGFRPGTDRKLIDYEQLTGYLQALAGASDRVEMREAGHSPMGRPMYVVFISSPANLARLEELRGINRELALEPSLDAARRGELVRRGRVFLMETLSMHSTEVGPSQAFPLIARELATTRDPDVVRALADVVLMVVPCHNPDGMDMVVEHYRKTVGTPYEGSSLPGLYHKYVGHDNNRDFVTLTQDDTRVINRLDSTEWFPQILVEKHQMGRSGPRYFVPSNHDPIALNVDEGLWTWMAVMGANLSRDMTADGLSGVASHWLFDNYWPGSTETALWKNVIALLTECASCRVATPVYVEPEELRVHGKGLSEYAKSVNMPDPWPGGWWRLADIVRYERASTLSLLATASRHREEILRFRNDLCRKEVAKGRSEPPAYFVLPQEQHDPGALAELVDLLRRHGVRVDRLTRRVSTAGRVLQPGDVVVRLAQPYRAFVKEVMEAQRYPVRHYTPGGEVIRPYDIASWSLPLHRGLTCWTLATVDPDVEDALEEVTAPIRWHGPHKRAGRVRAYGLSANLNESYRAAFAALASGLPVLRLTGPVDSGDTHLPAGSFLLPAGSHPAALRPILKRLAAAPAELPSIPEAAKVTLSMPRVALVETWFHHMDAGWTRYILDRYGVPYSVLRPGEVAEADLGSFDVLLFPDADPDVLMKGRWKEGEDDYGIPDLAPEYRKGLGKNGMQAVVRFIDRGGVALAWGRATGIFTRELEEPVEGGDPPPFRLPVRDVGERLAKQGLYVPGSLLRAAVRRDHPLTWGLPEEVGVFSRGVPALVTSIPNLDMDRRIVAAFPPEGDLLLSGYAEHQELLHRHPAAVWVRKGKGQIVLMAFSPQFRASTHATYKLLFNGLLLRPAPAARTPSG